MSLNKFFPLPELAQKIAGERNNNRKIALANGGFDLIHIGHIRYLQAAQKTADILVVALNSDYSLKKLKGSHRAIIDEQGRVKIIAALACVDYVTLFDDPTVDGVLSTLKPDFHCKGADYTPDTVPERETVRAYGGRVAIVGGDKIRSTSEIIARIRKIDLH
jgi:rfaE bifunctional protein nucleotidyltransferase chain/domain